MTVEQTNVVDFVTYKKDGSGYVGLVISDHLSWDGDEEEGEHLLLLQEKLNNYFEFVESGQLYEKYPDLRGRPVVIEIANMYPLSEKGKKFFRLVAGRCEELGMRLRLMYPSPD